MATTEEKIKIASGFLRAAPPGEINDVFNDVRGILGEDEAVEAGILDALAEYHTEELATVDIPGIEGKAIVSKHGQIENDRFLHPKSNKAFKLDHFRQIASDPADHTVDPEIEDLRKVIENDVELYVADRYTEGVVSVYGTNGVITIAIVHSQYSPTNFWNGRWRSVWTLDTSTSAVKGTIHVKVHYYEDGNVQLETTKEVDERLSKTSSDPHKDISKALVDIISSSEQKYQVALNESYSEMAEGTFSGLRRALPYTRMKIDWDKILTYRVGAELSSR
ncbi:F-actin-capping protein subunit alpha [Mortierella sp. GBAus27b]|nr:F-actin-capping protein subunit alpha [Mortierella sp. GBAus27b]